MVQVIGYGVESVNDQHIYLQTNQIMKQNQNKNYNIIIIPNGNVKEIIKKIKQIIKKFKHKQYLIEKFKYYYNTKRQRQRNNSKNTQFKVKTKKKWNSKTVIIYVHIFYHTKARQQSPKNLLHRRTVSARMVFQLLHRQSVGA